MPYSSSRTTCASFAAVALALAAASILSAAVQTQQEPPPDMFEYLDQPVAALAESVARSQPDERVTSIELVRIDLATLVSAVPINLNLRGMIARTVLDDVHVEPYADGGYGWIGAQSQEDTEAEVILVWDGTEIMGTIRTANAYYRLWSTDEDAQILVQVEERESVGDHPPQYQDLLDNRVRPPQLREQHAAPPRCDTIRVIVAYTPAAKIELDRAFGTTRPGISSFVAQAILAADRSYRVNNVGLDVELAHLYETDYEEQDITTDRDRFVRDRDGFMDDVHRLRNRYLADVAVLLRKRAKHCGLAGAIGATAQTAFAVVDHGCAIRYLTFVHELGHLHGAWHNPEIKCCNDAFRYGHGYIQPATGSRTVMAGKCEYAEDGCRRTRWSDPRSWFKGQRMGTRALHDNARLLRETACRVTQFR